MSRHLGIVLAALGSVLALALAACTATDEARPTQPNTGHPSTTRTRAPQTTTPSQLVTPSTAAPIETREVDLIVPHPKHVDDSTRCEEVIPPADASAATGATATLTSSAPFICSYVLKNTPDFGGGVLTIMFFGRNPAVSATMTTVSGNTAAQEREDDERCFFFVVLDSKRPLDAKGAVLGIHAILFNRVDPCQAARELVEKGFARLPDA